MRVVVALAGIAVLILTACSSTVDGSPSAVAAGSFPASSSAPGVPDLDSQLLTLADLPAGWSIDNSPSDDSSEPSCLAKIKSPARAIAEKEREFAAGVDFPIIDQMIGYFGSSSLAQQDYARGVAGLNSCKSFDQPASDGTPELVGKLRLISFPSLGDKSTAWRLDLSTPAIQGPVASLELVVIVKGSEISLIDYGDVAGHNLDVFTSIAKTAAAKLR